MNTPRVTRFFLALCVSFVPAGWLGSAQAQGVLRVEAVDRTSTLKEAPETRLFLGASFNGWDPAGTVQSGWLEEGGVRTGWVFEIPRPLVDRGGEFKLTRGSWDTVETTAEGQMIENRRTGDPDWGSESPVVRCEVLGFQDQFESDETPDPGSVVRDALEVWTIASEVLGEDRTVRVWLPEAYEDSPDRSFGVFYFNDGQNVFDTRTSSFGVEWGADEAVTKLAAVGSISPRIVVGIDHSGANRARDYLPFKPGRAYPTMPGGGADAYLRFIIEELMPEIARRYRVKAGPAHTGMGGSSLGGVITLHAAMHHPDVFGAILSESPSLWIGDAQLIRSIEAHEGEWSGRVFIGIGDAETGVADQDAGLVAQAQTVAGFIRSDGLGEDRLRMVIGEGHRHNESGWQQRLPSALEFLLRETGETDD